MNTATVVTLYIRFEPGSDVWLDYPIPKHIIQRLTPTPSTLFHYVAEQIYRKPGCMYPNRECRPEEFLRSTEGWVRNEFFFSSPYTPKYIDVNVLDDRHSVSSSEESKSLSMTEQTRDRDRNCCVISGASRCEVAHLIPHAKHSPYMIALHDTARDTSLGVPQWSTTPVEDIDDPRNCICLTPSAHDLFGVAEAAFLRIPNHRMSFNNVYLSDNPIKRPSGFDSKDFKVIFQDLGDVPNPIVAPFDRTPIFIAPDPNNSVMPHPLSLDPVLLDLAYGAVFLCRWGRHTFPRLRSYNQDFLGRVRNQARAVREQQGTFYPSNEDDAKQTRASHGRTRKRDREGGLREGMEIMMSLHQLVSPGGAVIRIPDSRSDALNTRVQKWLENIPSSS